MNYYLSLVGNQVMAVLNPLLSLQGANYPIHQIILLPTKQSQANADIIKKFVGSSAKSLQVEIHPVSSSLLRDGELLPAPDKIREILQATEQDERLYFNIAGGMNFQLAACVPALDWGKTTFLYPEIQGIHEIHHDQDKIRKKLLALPSPVDVLALQQVPHVVHGGEIHRQLAYALRQAGIRLPQPTYNIEIGGLVFDCMWNDGNMLRFIKVLEQTANNEHDLALVRQVDALGSSRQKFGELFHRSIAVLAGSALVRERVETEGQGKIEVFAAQDSWALKKFCGVVRSEPEAAVRIDRRTETGNTSVSDSGNVVLYTTIGENLMSTLIAVWSHAASAVCLFYTPADPEIVKIKDAMLNNKRLLPTRHVCFYPVDIAGSKILEVAPASAEGSEAYRRIVNISPGTKGHTVFLTRWAQLHDAEIWSLKQPCIGSISPPGKERPAQAPDAKSFLLLKGENVQSSADDKSSLLTQAAELQKTWETLQRILPSGNDEELAKITEPTGLWFEKLVAFLLLRSGADDVDVRLRIPWDEEIKRQKGLHQDSFKTDCDVVARFGTNYYMIECKATKRENSNKVAWATSARAALFGRFTIPVVVFLRYAGEPVQEGGVYVIGYRSFLDPQVLKATLDKAWNDKRKTAQ
jgi:hypothetical protein